MNYPRKLFLSRREAFAYSFHIPTDFVKGNLFISLMGKTEVFIENYLRMIEYTPELIRLASCSGECIIVGKRLKITSYNELSMWITGYITGFTYPGKEAE